MLQCSFLMISNYLHNRLSRRFGTNTSRHVIFILKSNLLPWVWHWCSFPRPACDLPQGDKNLKVVFLVNTRDGSRDFKKGGRCMSATMVGFRWSKTAKITLKAISFWQNISVSIFKFSLFLYTMNAYYECFLFQWMLTDKILSTLKSIIREVVVLSTFTVYNDKI